MSVELLSMAGRMSPRSPSPSPDAARMALREKQRTNLATYWWTHRLLSHDRVERHFNFLIALLVSATLLFGVLKTTGPVLLWGSPICTFWAALLVVSTLGNVYAEQRERWMLFEITRGCQFLLTMLSVLIYYEGSNAINRHRYEKRGDAMLYDETLLRMDEAIWGWLWPKGQMALWLDTQPTFGVTTPIGRLYAEILQLLYVSYYFWGNAIGVILAAKYFYNCVYLRRRGMRKRVQWRCIQMFVSAWVGGFVLNHLINLCFPAVSPRIYLAEYYQNEIKGVWLLGGMRNAITNAAANTFSAFPSGHCGLSLLAVLLAYRVHLHTLYTWAVCVSTVLIVFATQVLRYHYFCDFAFSLVIVAFGAWLGGFHDWQLYHRCLEEMGLEDTDDAGKPLVPSPDGPTNATAFDRDRETVPLTKAALGAASRAAAAAAAEDDEELGLANGQGHAPLVLSSAVFGNQSSDKGR